MKKFSSFFASVAIAVLGVLCVSCFHENPKAPTATNGVIPEGSYTLKLASDIEATFTLGGQSQTGKVVTFKTSSKTVTVTVSAPGYIDQTVNVTFSDDQKVTSVLAKLVKPSTTKVAQAAAKGTTVSNDATNQSEVVPVSITVPAAVTITGNTTDPFSVTAVPAAPEVFDPEVVASNVGSVINQTALTLVCEPDGAVFDTPVTLSATIPGSAGLAFNVLGATNVNVSAANVVSFDVTHFSEWWIDLQVTPTSVTEGSEQIHSSSLLVSSGQHSVSFQKNIGYQTSATNNLIVDFLDNTFGKYEKATSEVDFSVDGSGSATVIVRQAYKDFTFTCGTQTFTVRVWGECTPTITTTIDTSSHSGGALQ